MHPLTHAFLNAFIPASLYSFTPAFLHPFIPLSLHPCIPAQMQPPAVLHGQDFLDPGCRKQEVRKLLGCVWWPRECSSHLQLGSPPPQRARGEALTSSWHQSFGGRWVLGFSLPQGTSQYRIDPLDTEGGERKIKACYSSISLSLSSTSCCEILLCPWPEGWNQAIFIQTQAILGFCIMGGCPSTSCCTLGLGSLQPLIPAQSCLHAAKSDSHFLQS